MENRETAGGDGEEISLTRFCATLCRLMGVEPPARAEAADEELGTRLREVCPGVPERVLLHNADAMARWLFRERAELLRPVTDRCPAHLPMCAAMPSVTPVCFATMYTGAPPAVHGLMKYEKRVLRIDTMFDALFRAGRRAAIVAVKGSSMSVLFGERETEVFIEPDDEAACQRALGLLQKDEHDFLAVYTQDYDTVMHKTGVLSPESLRALGEQAATFGRLWDAAAKAWSGRQSLMGFCTDHGVHEEEALGVGAHGSDNPLDLEITHYFGAPSR